MFIDNVTLRLAAGKGGNGVVAWRREKYIPKGGPAGGDGGNGGSVILKATSHQYSLEEYRNIKIRKADNGASGGSNNQKGKNGKDILLRVPLGTLVKCSQTKEIIYDFTKLDEEFVICRGGKGGKGNTYFKSSTNRAPDQFTEGKYGQQIEVDLELKLIADIGLVGMPNAGKSTLISQITLLPVKIAPYPFTTLIPNLGILEFDDFKRILIADIPGIIKDASMDRGLGLSFLKHIERTKALLFVLDVSGEVHKDPYEDFLLLQRELNSYSPEMLNKPFLVILNKADVEGSDFYIEKFQEKYKDPSTLLVISAKEKTGFNRLKKQMKELIHSELKATYLSS